MGVLVHLGSKPHFYARKRPLGATPATSTTASAFPGFADPGGVGDEPFQNPPPNNIPSNTTAPAAWRKPASSSF